MSTETTLWQRRVTYAAVGGTKAADLLRYPPRGFRSTMVRTRIGHGDARWEYACARAFTWELQRRAGFDVEVAASPAEVTEGTYVAVGFNTSGIPVVPAGAAQAFDEDTLKPGDSAILRTRLGPIDIEAPVRVVYVIDDPERRGFGVGTLPGHPLSGEESFLLEREPDGSVWLTVCSFSRPASLAWRLLGPLLRFAQAQVTQRYLRSLAGPIRPRD